MFRGNDISPHSSLPSEPLFSCLWFQLLFSAVDTADLVTHGFFLCTLSPFSYSVVIHCYDLTAHLGAADPDVYPAVLSSRAKNSTAFSWILCRDVGHQSVLVIHTYPSSCRYCQPLLLFLKPIPSSSSIAEPTVYHLLRQSHLQVILCDSISQIQSGRPFCQLCFPFTSKPFPFSISLPLS